MSHTLRGEGFDASEDGTGRGTPLVPVGVFQDSEFGVQRYDSAGTLRAGRIPEHQMVLQPIAIQERAVSENIAAGPGGSGISTEGAAYTLEARNKVQAVAFDSKGTQVQTDEAGTAPTLRAMGHADSHQNGGGKLAVAFGLSTQQEPKWAADLSPSLALPSKTGGGQVTAVAFDLRGREGGAMPEGPHDTANIRAASGGSSRSYVAAPWAVRRLTPRECERLQGFPDDFTLIPYRGKPASDGPRYKALGNSWAVNCADWIGERIAEVDTW